MVFVMQEVIFQPPGPPPKKNIPLVYQESSTTEGSAGFLINGQCKPTLQIKSGQNYRWRFINGTGTPRGLMKLRLIKMSDNPNAVINDTDVFDQGQDPVAPGTTILPVKQRLNNRNAYMNLIAVDGLTFYGFNPQPVQRHLMAPGNRADFIINIPRTSSPSVIGGPGKYVLVKDAFPKDGVSYQLQPSLDCSQANQIVVAKTVPASLRTNQVLAYIEVYPGFVTEPLPTLPKTRPFNLQPIATVDKSRTGANAIAFQGIGGGAAGGGSGAGGGNFFINCKVYDPNDPGIVAQLNTAEEWELQNFGNTDFPHPFHIHVNPFQIKGRTIDFETDNPKLDPNNPCNWIWQDTVAIPATIDMTVPPFTQPKVCPPPSPTPTPRPTPSPIATPTPVPTPVPCPTPPANPGSVNIRTRFLVYPGEYVIHCHILIHEDVGMMSNVTIQDPTKQGVGPCTSLATPTQGAIDCVNRTKPSGSC
jgi:FtsP/CotA-like multicopper oxidase with cupredoxin domain